MQKSDTLALLEKEQKQVQKAIDGFLSAIAVGIVTKSTKEKLLALEQQNDELESKIAVEKSRQIQPLNYDKVKAFLNYFAKKQYKNDEEKNEFFNSFIYRVVLFDNCVYIFYNTSPSTPTKVKLDKNDLTELREYRTNRKSTQFVPLGFKLGACGRGGGIRTPVALPPNGFQDRLVMTASIRLHAYYYVFKCTCRGFAIINHAAANVKSIKLVAVDYLAEIYGVKVFFAVHLLLESFV